MTSDILMLIDDTIQLAKSKDDSNSYHGRQSLFRFELKFFLCLDIIRFELQSTKRMSDLTADAINQLLTFQCFEFYYRDFPAVHKKCLELSQRLSDYNEKLKNFDLKGEIGVSDERWTEYFNKAIKALLTNSI